MNRMEVATGGPILRTFSTHPSLYLLQQVNFSDGRSIPVKLLSETGPNCRNSRRIVARLCEHNSKIHGGVSIDCGIKGQMVAKNDGPSLCNLGRWPLWNQNFGGVALEFGRGARMRCQAQKDQKRGSSKSQRQQGEAGRKDAQESKSSDTGVQGGGGFAGLASLKAQLEDAATPIRNADDEERKAEFVARASLKRIPPTNSSNPKTNQLVGTSMLPTTGRQSTSQNPSQEKGLKTHPYPRTTPRVSNKGTHVQSNVSSPESDKGPSQRAAWKVENKVKKPPQKLGGGKTEATPVGNTSSSFEAWKKNSLSEYDSGSESDDGQGTSKGTAILAAMQRAAAADRAKSTRRRRNGDNVTKVENQGGSKIDKEMPLKPILLKQEWIDQIQSLEKRLNDLKHI